MSLQWIKINLHNVEPSDIKEIQFRDTQYIDCDWPVDCIPYKKKYATFLAALFGSTYLSETAFAHPEIIKSK